MPGLFFEVPVLALGVSLAFLKRLKSLDHSLAVVDHFARIAFFKGSRHGKKFSTKNRLPAARRRQPDTFSSVGH
eukprot:6288756-Amphidinium_carterae.2